VAWCASILSRSKAATDGSTEEEAFGAGCLGLSGIGESGGGTGQGFGSGHGRLGGSHATTGTSGKITVGDLAAIAGSHTEESGRRFAMTSGVAPHQAR
jgi:hypothetical protein